MLGARHASARDARFAQIAQAFPLTGEVAREKHHQQDFDQLDGLEDAQVHFGVVARRAAAERHQEAEQGQRGEQRRVAPAREAAVIEDLKGGQREQQRPDEDADGELLELQRIAQGIAHAHHQEETESGKKLQGGQECGVAAEFRQTPEQRHEPKSGEVEQRRAHQLRAKLGGGAHRNQRLDASELAARNHRGQRAGVAQRPGTLEVLVDARREFRAIGKEFQHRHQFIGRRHRIHVEHGPSGHALNLRLVDKPEAGGDQQRRCRQPRQANRGPVTFDADHHGRGARHCPTARHSHGKVLRLTGLRGAGGRIWSSARKWRSASSKPGILR